MIVSLLGLFFSFVRAAWVGFGAGAIIMLFYRYKGIFTRLSFSLYIKKLSFVLLILIVTIITFPAIKNVLWERFYPTYDPGARINMKNVRVSMMKTSFNATLRNPIIGNGPGSAAFNYLVEEKGEQYAINTAKTPETSGRSAGFNPSILFTIIEDTGLLGLITFLWLVFRITKYNFRNTAFLEEKYQVIASGLFGGLTGLFVSYFFSQGLWLPFTWVFLAFNIIVLRIDVFGNDSTKYCN